jgi:hypothetical protein
MNHQASRTLQQTHTPLAPADVLAAATEFFARPQRQSTPRSSRRRGRRTSTSAAWEAREVVIASPPTMQDARDRRSCYSSINCSPAFLATLPRAAVIETAGQAGTAE